jgi:hypothetical protein
MRDINKILRMFVYTGAQISLLKRNFILDNNPINTNKQWEIVGFRTGSIKPLGSVKLAFHDGFYMLYRDTCSNTLNRSPAVLAILSRQLLLSEHMAILSRQQLRGLGHLPLRVQGAITVKPAEGDTAMQKIRTARIKVFGVTMRDLKKSRAVFFVLGNSPVSELYVRTFQSRL